MRNVTFAELKTRARERADMVNSQFISTAELERLINESITELYDLLVTSYDEDYYLTDSTIALIDGQEEYDLPADFYKLRGVDLENDPNSAVSLKQFNFQERNRYKNALIFDYSRDGITGSRYRLYGNKIKFTPIPDLGKTIRLWYTPVAEKLVDDGDTFDGINGYEELVVIKCAIKMLGKEESDTKQLERRFAEMWQRVVQNAPNRDAANPDTVQDTRRDYYEEDYAYHDL